MDLFADFRSVAAIVAVLVVLVAAGMVLARRLRSRASPPPSADPAPDASDAAYLDSSHIISGSVLRAVPPVSAGDPAADAADDDLRAHGGRDAAPRQ